MTALVVRFRLPAALLAIALVTTACAARSEIQTASLSVGELSLAVDQAERDAYAGKLYDAERHAIIGKSVLRLLYAARAFERTVAAEANPEATRAELLRALDDIEKTAQGVPPILTAVGAIRSVLSGGNP